VRRLPARDMSSLFAHTFKRHIGKHNGGKSPFAGGQRETHPRLKPRSFCAGCWQP
jgi:hypothetical protein